MGLRTLRKPLETIHESGRKAAAIVQDLLTLARRGVAVSEVVNLNDLLSEYLISPEFKKLIAYHPLVDINTAIDSGTMNIMGSPIHLSKTIMNLVSNAVEAMPAGGTINVSTANECLDTRLNNGFVEIPEGEYVVLTVSDSGIGISEEDIDKIFEPFYSKKKMGRSGTGLGMAVVWGTVQDHKGYIDIDSIQGKGTTFKLYFPITKNELIESKKDASVEELTGGGESILVVDDVREQREILSRLLSQLKYSVNTVSNGHEAVEYMKYNRTDLVILDMIMDPGIDGLETYRQILEIYPDQKAIIVSGFSETERVKEAQKLGAGKYIKKPYSIVKIGTAVKSELHPKSLQV